jgi:two-component system sensor histidine kinase KdpD
MLDLARLERGAQIASPMPGDLTDGVTRCLERLLPSLADAGLAVELDIEDDLPTAVFDEDALCQILDNLLDNAEKYTRNRPDRRARVAARSTPEKIRITVSDNGPGIPAGERLSLFKPFRRPGDANAPAGLGLGLALARSLARAQGGDLELGNVGDSGAIFVLTVPTDNRM